MPFITFFSYILTRSVEEGRKGKEKNGWTKSISTSPSYPSTVRKGEKKRQEGNAISMSHAERYQISCLHGLNRADGEGKKGGGKK